MVERVLSVKIVEGGLLCKDTRGSQRHTVQTCVRGAAGSPAVHVNLWLSIQKCGTAEFISGHLVEK
jgi:hypothetical protein